MLRVDLITGFLGAGKTTFIRGYLKYLRNHGITVSIIENEFGPISVDTALLKESHEHCDITDLTGLCMCCTGRSEFIYQLCESARKGIQRVIVEPSGIYDVDEFFDVMDTPEVSAVCEIGSILTIVDAGAVICPTEEARYLSFCQLLSAGSIILSKTQCGRNNSEQAKQEINQIMKAFDCPYETVSSIVDKPWTEFSDTDYDSFTHAGYNRFIHDRMIFSHTETFQTSAFAIQCKSIKDIEGRIRRLFRANVCGKVYRVKGFVRDDDGLTYEVNCTAGNFSVIPSDSKQKLLVVIGQHLNEEAAARILGGSEEMNSNREVHL